MNPWLMYLLLCDDENDENKIVLAKASWDPNRRRMVPYCGGQEYYMIKSIPEKLHQELENNGHIYTDIGTSEKYEEYISTKYPANSLKYLQDKGYEIELVKYK